MRKIKVGDVCIIDPTNKLNFAGEGIVYAKVIRLSGFFIFKKAINNEFYNF